MLRTVNKLCALALGFVWLVACDQGKTTTSQVSTPQKLQIASSREIASSFAAADNPYAGKYSAWDQWVVDNIYQSTLGPDFRASQNMAPDEMVFETTLDENGFLIPVIENIRLREEHRVIHNPQTQYAKDRQWVYAIGRMDSDLFDPARAAGDRVIAGMLPDIPDWLPSLEFRAATVLEDGRVVVDMRDVFGQSHAEMDQHSASHAGHTNETPKTAPDNDSAEKHPETHRLYSPSGQLLKSTTEGVWWSLFGASVDRSAFPEDYHTQLTDDGYYQVIDDLNGHVHAVYDFDGALLSTHTPPRRDPHMFAILPKDLLVDYHKAQN